MRNANEGISLAAIVAKETTTGKWNGTGGGIGLGTGGIGLFIGGVSGSKSQKEIDELLNAIKTGHSKFILSIPVHTTHPMAHKIMKPYFRRTGPLLYSDSIFRI